jgi:hypothetical protein
MPNPHFGDFHSFISWLQKQEGTVLKVENGELLPVSTDSFSGGGGGVTVLTADIAHDTPGLTNPENFGPALLTIPAGSLFQVFVLVSIPWDVDGLLDLVIDSDDQGSNTIGYSIAEYIPQNSVDTSEGDGGAYAEPMRSGNSSLTATTVQRGIPRWGFAVLERVVCVGFYPAAGNPTAGAGKVVALYTALV